MQLNRTIVIGLFLLVGCHGPKNGRSVLPAEPAQPKADVTAAPKPNAPTDTEPEAEPIPEPTPLSTPYPGRTIDQVFAPIAEHDFGEPEFVDKRYSVPVDGLRVNVRDFRPESIARHGQTVLRFKTVPSDIYSSNVVGESHLLGPHSNQIYISAGSGAICCNEDWIVDITHGHPRTIFHTDDWGYFYGGLELFDADGDGIDEIADFEASFRYVADLLGGSSPWPKAVWKYDAKFRRYVPAPWLQQDFVRRGDAEEEKWIIAESRNVVPGVPATMDEYRLTVIDLVADLLFEGRSRHAWALFNRYYPRAEQKPVRADILDHARKSPYLRAISRMQR
jgi:hypothetical protein